MHPFFEDVWTTEMINRVTRSPGAKALGLRECDWCLVSVQGAASSPGVALLVGVGSCGQRSTKSRSSLPVGPRPSQTVTSSLI